MQCALCRRRAAQGLLALLIQLLLKLHAQWSHVDNDGEVGGDDGGKGDGNTTNGGNTNDGGSGRDSSKYSGAGNATDTNGNSNGDDLSSVITSVTALLFTTPDVV